MADISPKAFPGPPDTQYTYADVRQAAGSRINDRYFTLFNSEFGIDLLTLLIDTLSLMLESISPALSQFLRRF